jgi:RNA polymerase sigma factor (sigma-70 family)
MRPFEEARLKEIESLYRSRFPHFVQVATAIVGDSDLALEAVQDAFAGVVRSRRTFRGEGPMEAWIWRAVVNASYRARRVPEGRTSEAPCGRNGYERVEESGLWPHIASLPDRQRAALFLRYYADLDYRSIAEALGIEVGTVSATLSAAHTSLRRSLGKARR